MRANKTIRNVFTAAKDPRILLHYVVWHRARLGLGSAQLNVLGCQVGGFPNFSSYLGALRHGITEEEVAFIRSQLAGAKCIIDVGANFGSLAIPFAKIAPDAKIFAFEPNPVTAKALRRNVVNNGVKNVSIIEAAVSDLDGTLHFSDSGDPATNKILPVEASEGLVVKARSLVSFCQEHEIDRIDFLKIDVEGAELLVLEGGKLLFERGIIKSGLIEICPNNLKNFGRSIRELTEFFASVGYAIDLIGPKRGEPIDEHLRFENASFVKLGAR